MLSRQLQVVSVSRYAAASLSFHCCLKCCKKTTSERSTRQRSKRRRKRKRCKGRAAEEEKQSSTAFVEDIVTLFRLRLRLRSSCSFGACGCNERALIPARSTRIRIAFTFILILELTLTTCSLVAAFVNTAALLAAQSIGRNKIAARRTKTGRSRSRSRRRSRVEDKVQLDSLFDFCANMKLYNKAAIAVQISRLLTSIYDTRNSVGKHSTCSKGNLSI